MYRPVFVILFVFVSISRDGTDRGSGIQASDVSIRRRRHHPCHPERVPAVMLRLGLMSSEGPPTWMQSQV
jgi:hypothetical protein